jgi:hypothetical protein
VSDKTTPPAGPVVPATPAIPDPKPVTPAAPTVKPLEIVPGGSPAAPSLPSLAPQPPETPAPKQDTPTPKLDTPKLDTPAPKLPEPTAPKPVETPERKTEPAPFTAPTDPPATFRPVAADTPKPTPEPKDARPAVGTLNLTKPPTEPGVRPAANQETPKSDYDVDLHRPKADDTYESISRQYYRDARYAEALKQYNRGAELGRVVDVYVPPMYVLRQRFSQLIGAARGSSSPEWSSPAGRERK